MLQGAMTLLDWMTKTGSDIRSVAKELECSIYAVRKWVRKERVPRPPMQVKIKAMTAGKVSGDDWMPQA